MRKIPKGQKTKTKFPCEICGIPEYLEDHHIRGRKIPDYNHRSNRCNICSNCHTKTHIGEIIIEGWVMTSSGHRLFWHNKNEESFTGDDAIPHIIGKEKQSKSESHLQI
jgi:hypothetical protein